MNTNTFIKSHLWLSIVFIVAGCTRYAGCISGSQAIPESKLQNCFIFQFDTYEGSYNESKRRPLFAIVWQAHRVGEVSSDGRNMITSIHGKSIAPSRAKKGFFALQSDYSLKQLTLTEAEIDRLFSLVQTNIEGSPRLASDPIWKEKVQTNLKVVEPPSTEK